MNKQPFGDAIMHRVCDGDFNEVMRSVNFSCDPRKTVTVGHMENFNHIQKTRGREALVEKVLTDG